MDGEWAPGRWWRITAPDGTVWCEANNEDEARRAVRPGDSLQRQWLRTQEEWRPAGAVTEEPCRTRS